MSNCLAPGWGTGPYGQTSWGGSLSAVPGGSLPVELPFDIYCVGPCGPMSVITTFVGVDEIGAPDQFSVDPITLDEVLRSGGAFSTTDVRLIITASVPQVFTFDFTVLFQSLPVDFSSLVDRHVFIGLTDAAGPCVGLFFSKTGIAYVGGIHHDGSGNMVLDSVFQQLANSQLLISEGEYWSFRIAANSTTGGVYIYITKTADLPIIGHQLRYVMPVIPAEALSFTPTDRTLISLRGTAGDAVSMALDSICLGSGFIIPNIPPVADAGADQSTQTCSIIQLDASKSFDPEGAAITYQWRLIDAPLGSTFVFEGVDGRTYDEVSNFTNKFYSASLAVFHGVTPLVSGDVLVVGGQAHKITGTAVDGNGFHALVDGFVLPDSFLMTAFKVIKQNGISGATSTKPTFYPDLPGLYKFDLVVFDGGLFSSPSITVVNVSESPVPRGCYPDMRFLWDYLSNFWNLLEDRERITTFWTAAAQVAASELLTLWQVDYNKSLRDVQRTFQRRWLHYDPLLVETLPEGNTVRALMQGCRSVELAVAGTSAYNGTTITFTSPALSAAISYTFPAGVLTPANIRSSLEANLKAVDSRFSVQLIDKRPAATFQVLRIYAPFAFSITHPSAMALMADFANALPSGTGGASIGVKTYHVDRSLSGLGITDGDILVLDGVGYRINRVLSDISDTWPDQRVTLYEDLPIAPPASWAIPSRVTSTDLDFYKQLVSVGDQATLLAVDEVGTETTFVYSVVGVAENLPNVLGVDMTSLAHLLLDGEHTVQLGDVRRYRYIPIDDLVVDIPHLQERILNTDDTQVLRRNLDFFLERHRDSNAIRFAPEVWDAPPPDIVWAETTYLDNRPVIEQNFGIPAEFTLDNLAQLSNVDYLSAVRGLWYSYFHGPTLFNLRAGTQILLGLPYAEEAGVIEEIRTDYSPTQGRILIRDSVTEEHVRSYTFPAMLEMEVNPATGTPYVVGDSVAQFAPLVTGVEVLDWVSDPRWFEGYLQQGVFLEVEKFHKFLVRVDSAGFNLSALLFIKTFVRKIKPTYTYPLFVVLQTIGDTEISVTDAIAYKGTLLLFDGTCTDSTYGMATMFDEPDPSGGGWQSQFDADSDPATAAPVHPTGQPVAWGFDKNLLCPEDFIIGSACITEVAAFYPSVDSIFSFDSQIQSTAFAIFQDSWITHLPDNDTGATLFLSPTTMTVGGTITDLELEIVGHPGATSIEFEVVIAKNGSDHTTVAFDHVVVVNFSSFKQGFTVNIPVIIGDTLSARVRRRTSGTRSPLWKTIQLELAVAVTWAYDVQLPAGTYCTYRPL